MKDEKKDGQNSDAGGGAESIIPKSAKVNVLKLGLVPLSMADPSPYRPKMIGATGQENSDDPVVADIGSALDWSVLKFLQSTTVSIPASILLHFQAAFSIPRLMRAQDTYGAARATLLTAALNSLANQQPSADQLTELGAQAQALGLDVSPEDILATFMDRISYTISRKAATPVIRYLTSAGDDVAEYSLVRDVPAFNMAAFAASLDNLSSMITDLVDMGALSTLQPFYHNRVVGDPFLRAIHSLIKIRRGYQLTMIPTTLAHALAGGTLILPQVERWKGMDEQIFGEDDAARTVPGQFKFYEVEPVFAKQLTIVDVAETLSYLDEQVMGLPILDIDLTSFIETKVASGGSRAFIVRPNFGTLTGRNLFLPLTENEEDSDPVHQAFNSLIAVAVLNQVFTPTSPSPILTKIRGLLSRYRQGDDATPYANDLDVAAETLAAVYTGVMSVRAIFEDILDQHEKFSKRFDELTRPTTNRILDSGAINRYLDLREQGYQPYFDVPVLADSPAALSSPAEIAVIPATFKMILPMDVFVSQQRWYHVSKDGESRYTISINSMPPPRFVDGQPVVLSSTPMNVHPLNSVGSLVGPTLTHDIAPFEVYPYSSLQSAIDFSAMVRLLPISRYLDAVSSIDDLMTRLVSDYINQLPLRVVDMSLSVLSNSFLLRSRTLAMNMQAEGYTWRQVMRIFNRFESGEVNDQVTITPTVIASHNGHAYDLGPDPVVFFPKFGLFVENTKSGTSAFDWYSVEAPLFVARPFAPGVAYPYDVDPLFQPREKFVNVLDDEDKKAKPKRGTVAKPKDDKPKDSGSDDESDDSGSDPDPSKEDSEETKP